MKVLRIIKFNLNLKTKFWCILILALPISNLKAQKKNIITGQNKNICNFTNNFTFLKNSALSACDTPYFSPCACPLIRDSFIPISSTPIKYFSLLIAVIDSAIYGVTQENIDSMMAGVNKYFNPWKISFCYSTIFTDSSSLSQYPQNKDSILNVLIYDWPNLGLSGQPIKIDYSVVTNNNYKGAYALAHEIAHDFALSHIFQFDTYPCSYSYRDRVDYTLAQQDTVGDFISQTPPTPLNNSCMPPIGNDSCSIGNPPWPSWGYENIMGYSFCSNAAFTPQQAGRMQCTFENNINPNFNIKGWLAYGNLYCNPNTAINNFSDEKIIFEIIPNPLNETANIHFTLPKDDNVKIELYNYWGEKISALWNQALPKNKTKTIQLNASNLTAGIYFILLKTNQSMITKKIVVIK